MPKAVIQPKKKMSTSAPDSARSTADKDKDKKTDIAKGIYVKPSDDEMAEIFTWIDRAKFSRPRKNFNRDFADGVLMAELAGHYFPKLVDMHNYQKASSVANKVKNWETLNYKVFSKVGTEFPQRFIQDIAAAKQGALEIAVKLFCEIIRAQAEIALEKKAVSEAQLASVSGSLSGCEGDFESGSYRQDTCYVVGDPPKAIIFQGEKLVPVSWVDEKNKQIFDLNEIIKGLKAKNRRQETLLGLRDKKLEQMAGVLAITKREKEELEKLVHRLETGMLQNKWVDPTGLV